MLERRHKYTSYAIKCEWLTIGKQISQRNCTARWNNPHIYSGKMELLKMVMLVNGFVHFTMALSVEGVHKGNLYYTAEKQKTLSIVIMVHSLWINDLHHSLLLSFLFTHAMHLPVYPSMPLYISCLSMSLYVACLSMPCTFPVYPYTMYDGCLSMPYAYFLLSMPRIMAVYPFNASFLLAIHVMAVYPSNPLHISYIYHVSHLSTMQHTKKFI